MWSMAHDWSAKKTRGFLFAVFAASKPAQIVLLSMAFGPTILRNVCVGLVFLPLVYLGSIAGLSIGNRIEKSRLRLITYVVLLTIAISAMVPVFVKLLN